VSFQAAAAEDVFATAYVADLACVFGCTAGKVRVYVVARRVGIKVVAMGHCWSLGESLGREYTGKGIVWRERKFEIV
jgi:hypothetical protein